MEFTVVELRNNIVQVKTNYRGLITLNHPIIINAVRYLHELDYIVDVSSSFYKNTPLIFGINRPSSRKGRILYFRVIKWNLYLVEEYSLE